MLADCTQLILRWVEARCGADAPSRIRCASARLSLDLAGDPSSPPCRSILALLNWNRLLGIQAEAERMNSVISFVPGTASPRSAVSVASSVWRREQAAAAVRPAAPSSRERPRRLGSFLRQASSSDPLTTCLIVPLVSSAARAEPTSLTERSGVSHIRWHCGCGGPHWRWDHIDIHVTWTNGKGPKLTAGVYH